ncbi:MAG: radical SAM protein, partial [Candidatus Delongbacteria bacterium]|nr:radical SAM protein [Candidatus Delongbacteria bacterium]
IPHLQECIFSGGESFLSKTYRDIWKDILRVNPNCRISVNTNGTVLTDEIKALMEAGNFFLNISIDSVNKTTYEKIRRGASFDQVMKNLDYFIDYSRRKDTILSMPVCPLTSNYKELPDIVAFCNSHGMFLEFVHVFNALNVNLQYASKAVLEDAYQVCSNVNIVPNDQVSEHNVNMLIDLCNKIQLWIREKTFREIFIDNLKPNESKYHKSMQKIETKVKTYLHQQKNNDEANAGFVLWKQKKDKLFDQLPNFMHDDFFYQSIVSMKPHILYNYIISMPLDELKISLQSFAKRIISDIGSSHTLKP